MSDFSRTLSYTTNVDPIPEHVHDSICMSIILGYEFGSINFTDSSGSEDTVDWGIN